MRAFVSYTLRDGYITRGVLSDLMIHLEPFCEPFIDLLWHPRGGHQCTLFSALRQADVFFLISSPFIMQSPWVCLELAAARQLRIPVVTIKNCYTTTIKNMHAKESYSHTAKHSLWCDSHTLYDPSYNLEVPSAPLFST